MTISNYDFVIRRNMEGRYSTRPVGRFWELVPAARKENKISGSAQRHSFLHMLHSEFTKFTTRNIGILISK